MNFDYSDEQNYLKDEVRRYLDDRCPTEAVRKVLDTPGLFHDAGLWAGVAEQGWLGVAIPEAYGGLGMGRVDLCAIAEELGRVVAPIPFASTVYGLSEALLLAGTEEQKAAWLPRIASGEIVGALATSERPGTLAFERIHATVRDGRLTGTKIPVTDGEIADVALVLAREGEGLSLFLVELTGVERAPLKTLDPTRGAAVLTFDAAPAERLGAPGEGLTLLGAVYDRMAVYFAFEQVGAAERCLDMAKGFALERYAFGRPIGSYQAIKHKLAGVYVKIQLARSNAYYGAWAVDADAPELPVAAAAARIAATDAFLFAAKENIQTHGGIGTTWEADCHIFYRRAQQQALVIGAPGVWKEKLVSALELRNAA
ncbi:MAG: acyl-CoA dehydrogenase family protein [Brevundimonas sp.]|nr:acyl-CoA dehydrogenase family protein [Brevundimonas sp.]